MAAKKGRVVRITVVLAGLGAIALSAYMVMPHPPGPAAPTPPPPQRHAPPPERHGPTMAQLKQMQQQQRIRTAHANQKVGTRPTAPPAEEFNPGVIQIHQGFFQNYSPGDKGQQQTDAKTAEFIKKQKEKAQMSSPAPLPKVSHPNVPLPAPR
jgi:hypothetical protein